MKKTFSIFVMLMLMLTGISAAFAANATSASNASTQTTVTSVATSSNSTTTGTEPSNDTKDTDIMTDHPGVTLRVTELQDRIQKAIVDGQAIISTLSAENKNVSVSGLQSILDQLKSLEQQAAQIDPNQDVSASTAQFVSIKKQAVDLVKQFRDTVRSLVPPGQRDELRKKANDAEATELKDLNQKEKQARKDYNDQVFADIANRLGVKIDDVEAKLQNGTISVQNAKEAIRNAFNNLSSDKKEVARQKLQEAASEFRVKRLANLERLKGQVQNKEEMAQDKNLTRLGQNLQNKENRINSRISNIQEKTNQTGGTQ